MSLTVQQNAIARCIYKARSFGLWIAHASERRIVNMALDQVSLNIAREFRLFEPGFNNLEFLADCCIDGNYQYKGVSFVRAKGDISMEPMTSNEPNETTEMWSQVHKQRQEKRADNRQSSTQQLKHAGIAFDDRNLGAHLIVSHHGYVIDFWPGTGLWIVRGKTTRHRGVSKLIKFCRTAEPQESIS